MSGLTDVPLVPADEQPLSPLFAVLLLVHILAGLIAVIAGALAARSRKRPGRHPRFGTIYCAALAVVFVTASGMGILRWAPDQYLVLLGLISFGAASLGYAARTIRWKRWLSYHITGMSLSYVVLLTAFYVDNGPRLPVGQHGSKMTSCRHGRGAAHLGESCVAIGILRVRDRG